MPLTIARLRLGIVALAALLLLVILGSFFYGRWRLRHIAQDLPARLGIQIQQSTRGFVLSQSNAQGRNLFTLHAARAIEFKSGGRVSLHDVKIDLYNQNGGQPDTIAGEDFEYDPHSEIVQSHGEARIVLQAAEAGSRSGDVDRSEDQPIRVTTHGLIFNRKTGLATCSGEVDFATPDASGQAVGAKFDSKLGHLLLESNVVLRASMHARPATLHASRAMYDRDQGQIDLLQPRYTSTTAEGKNSGAAAAATIFLRPDNSAQRMDARGGVWLMSAAGMVVRAPSMQVLLNDSNQPRQATLSGGVVFAGDRRGLDTHGDARQTQVEFDSQGRANRVVLDGEVYFHQQAGSGKNVLQRTLTANHLVLDLLPGRYGQARLQSAEAKGNAVFTSQSGPPGHLSRKTTLAADVLNTIFTGQNQPERVDGTGQTRLQMTAANGDVDTSTGDTLHVDFAPREAEAPTIDSPAAEKQTVSLTEQSIRSALQTGHVVLRQTQKGNGAQNTRMAIASAARASYVAAGDTLTLSGNPIVREGQLEMAARRVEFDRATGKALFHGAVQATIRSAGAPSGNHATSLGAGLLGGSQPVHIIATQAVLLPKAQQAVFTGNARLWQGSDMVEAPVIELSQKMQTLAAYSNPPCPQCVICSFLGQPAASGQAGSSVLKSIEPPAFRILTQRLLYSQAERKASFLHHVRMVSSAAALTADQAEVYLSPASVREATGFPRTQAIREPGNEEASRVEKIVATGNVRLRQPGRIASGSKLVYISGDEHFVLTGTEASPPEVVDRDRGTVSGQVLTFASRDQAIMVSGTSAHTTTTTTRIQPK